MISNFPKKLLSFQRGHLFDPRRLPRGSNRRGGSARRIRIKSNVWQETGPQGMGGGRFSRFRPIIRPEGRVSGRRTKLEHRRWGKSDNSKAEVPEKEAIKSTENHGLGALPRCISLYLLPYVSSFLPPMVAFRTSCPTESKLCLDMECALIFERELKWTTQKERNTSTKGTDYTGDLLRKNSSVSPYFLSTPRSCLSIRYSRIN